MSQGTIFTSGALCLLENPDQWAPTLTAHDPKPPIPLENASTTAATLYFLVLT